MKITLELILCSAIVRCFSPGILRPKLRVATVVPAAARERVVAALELARDLFVGGAAPRHQHHVESRQTEDRDGQQRHYSHYHHPEFCSVKAILEIHNTSIKVWMKITHILALKILADKIQLAMLKFAVGGVASVHFVDTKDYGLRKQFGH